MIIKIGRVFPNGGKTGRFIWNWGPSPVTGPKCQLMNNSAEGGGVYRGDRRPHEKRLAGGRKRVRHKFKQQGNMFLMRRHTIIQPSERVLEVVVIRRFTCQQILPCRQGSTSCSILPSRMREHGVCWENMGNQENTENMENINKMTLNTLIVIQNALIVNQMTQNIQFYGIYRDI